MTIDRDYMCPYFLSWYINFKMFTRRGSTSSSNYELTDHEDLRDSSSSSYQQNTCPKTTPVTSEQHLPLENTELSMASPQYLLVNCTEKTERTQQYQSMCSTGQAVTLPHDRQGTGQSMRFRRATLRERSKSLVQTVTKVRIWEFYFLVFYYFVLFLCGI